MLPFSKTQRKTVRILTVSFLLLLPILTFWGKCNSDISGPISNETVSRFSFSKAILFKWGKFMFSVCNFDDNEKLASLEFTTEF